MNKWQRIKYQPNKPLNSDGSRVTACKEHIELSKNAARQGMVLLKNDNHILPLKKGTRVALFGKATIDYVKGGGGSGDVTVSYFTHLADGFRQLSDHISLFEELNDFYDQYVKTQYNSGREPGLLSEPEVPEEIFQRAATFTDTAILSFCRFSGEGWDRKSSGDQVEVHAEPWVKKYAQQSNEIFEEGDFCLSKAEMNLVRQVKSAFPKVIVNMNVGGVVDSQWFVDDPSIGGVLMSWQGGMEGGSATAELLCGIGSPSGKLTDSFAKSLGDYPSTANYHESRAYVDYSEDVYVGYRYFETLPGAAEKVNYPFGFGLSYTEFSYHVLSIKEMNDEIHIQLELTNTGSYPGREVLQLYSMAPQGLLGKPEKELRSFVKSALLKPGEKQEISLSCNLNELASYDDTGKVQGYAYVLEKGEYRFFLGTSIRHGKELDYRFSLKDNRVVTQLEAKLVPAELKERLLADGTFESLPQGTPNNPDYSELENHNARELDGLLPQTRSVESTMNWKAVHDLTLEKVSQGKVDLTELIQQLSDSELIHLLGGQPNTGVANTFGWGNLARFGIPNAMTVDGPAGVRIERDCGVTTTAWPCSTLLASTWDEPLLYALGEAGAKEVKENNLAVWLTPAVNIHRSPLCGRNFEYFSEDPLVTGKLAAAMVRGIQSQGIAATVKHFAANNKETNRKDSDSRLSERAAREIYLKAFEIIVRESDPWAMMSSYNCINGHRASESRELLEDILRGEWNFGGVVTTDWWTHGEHYKEVLAGNDLKMASGHPERLKEALNKGLISRSQLEKSVKRVLELLLKLD